MTTSRTERTAGGLGARSESKRHGLLARLSVAQLGIGIAGLVLALERHHAYDLPLLHGHPDNVGRDSIVLGTALSAPLVMLATQGAATAKLLRNETDSAARILGVLGSAMVAGYLGESLGRRRLHPAHFDRLETPVVALGIGLAGAMAALGLSRS